MQNHHNVVGTATVCSMLDISRSTLNRRMKNDPRFPKPFKFHGSDLNYWLVSDILDYIRWSSGGGAAEVDAVAAGPKRPPPGIGQIYLDLAANDAVADVPAEVLRNASSAYLTKHVGAHARQPVRPRTVEVQVKKTRTCVKRHDER